MSHDPTPIRPGASQAGAPIDPDALQAAAGHIVRRWLLIAAQWLGLPLASASGTYYATRPADAPVEREQPSSGPEPKPVEPPECQPSADLLDAQERASRDARNAIDACEAMADELKRQRKEAESP